MIKRLFPMLLAVLLLSVTACAAGPELPESITATNVAEHTAATEYTLPQYYPTGIQTQTEDGVKLLLKTFEVGADVSPAALIESGFTRNGTEYELHDILRNPSPDRQEKKNASRSVTVESVSDKREDILPLFPKSVDYSENGFTGQLLLDEATISVEAGNTEGCGYTAADKDKCSVDDSEPGGYTVTAVYFGEAVRIVAGNVIYTLIYAAKSIASAEPARGADRAPVLLALGGMLFVENGAVIALLIRGYRQNAVPVSVNDIAAIPKKRMMKPKNLSDLLEDDDE